MERKQAEQLRKLLEKQTEVMPDKEIVEYPDFVEKWQKDKWYDADKRLEYNGEIYKVLPPGHTSQAQYPPSQATASLYARIDVEHAGTVEDPIPYRVNMEVFADKYYTEDGILYRCIRDSGTALQNKASELVGIYFTVA